ncbi:hypothetical protein Zmor_004162 [Zophobas morio]|uniref:Metallo-beta-lactamase domain-containing protein n=1 Tax=Zophobas morio TaxID=2755281 RepID=A0AA38HJC0_9CUCU|nr:hypothetical protein Zmor_004162 [Zophobas morio]
MNLEVVGIIITHTHFDHIVGLGDLTKSYPEATVYVTLDDLPGLFSPVLNLSEMFDTSVGSYVCEQPKKMKALFYDNDYDLDGIKFRVLPERGHSKGSVMLDFYEDEIIFIGEILQGDRADRVVPNLSDTLNIIEDNIRMIFKNYKSSYRVFPSHFEVDFSLGDIIKYNIRVQRILAMKN